MAWTNPFTRPLDSAQLSHFLRRAAFSPSPAQLSGFRGSTAASVFDTLAAAPTPLPPTDPDGKIYHDLAWGAPETDAQKRNGLDNTRRRLTKQWWLGLMLDPERGFAEKITLFWQNHFVIESDTVPDSRFQYRYLDTIRRNALGNFRTFVIEITKDPAMLYYLNGTDNTKDKPNENYGRELMELFTLGRDNYTESDVKAAARVLTGWKAINYRNPFTEVVASRFVRSQHDLGKKEFSENFRSKIIDGYFENNDGEQELVELVDMILARPESASFIVRKLYRWYFTGEISPEVAQNFIEPLADGFRKDYELLPLVRRMLISDHFFDVALRGGQIRSPLDFLVGSYIILGNAPFDPVDNRNKYTYLTSELLRRSRSMEMEVLEQPTVFGWRAYYDSGFYKIWISGTTLGLRGEWTDLLVKGDLRQGIQTDVLDWIASNVKNPADPLVLVREVWTLLMSVEATEAQLALLVDDAFLDGIPRYEWTEMWNIFVKKGLEDQVRARLNNLLSYVLRMAEYQLG